MNQQEYVWYVGYGSNLCRERFCCYIQGGKFRLGGSHACGCEDKTLPQETRPLVIPYKMYFACRSSGWGSGGVAFIGTKKENDHQLWSRARMWKITKQQFICVRRQEGNRLYDREICLGICDGLPVKTITSSKSQQFTMPSESYLSTIVIGLRETYDMNAQELARYLRNLDGVRGNFSDGDLERIATQAN